MSVSANIIGEDPNFLDAIEQTSRLAQIDKPCLVVGERGTGKELFTARLHYLSKRWDSPLIKINCATLTESLLESELFGHEAGAFTGAQKRHTGRFERADSGTLILDEIASASLSVQEKVLRVIEYGELERVGGNETIKVDVRVIGAANVDLPEMAEKGEFRADLLDRLAFDVITLPPLRNRATDILTLANHFAQETMRELNDDLFPGYTAVAVKQLNDYTWPGNVRELRNAIERTIHRRTSHTTAINQIHINPFDSQWQLGKAPVGAKLSTPTQDFTTSVSQYEKQILIQALQTCRHNQTETAQALNLSYHQFRRLLKKHGIATKIRD